MNSHDAARARAVQKFKSRIAHYTNKARKCIIDMITSYTHTLDLSQNLRRSSVARSCAISPWPMYLPSTHSGASL